VSDRDDRMSAAAEAAWRAFADGLEPDDDAERRVLQRVHARTRPVGRDDEPALLPERARRAAAAVFVVKSSAISVGLATGTLLAIKLAVVGVQVISAPSAPIDPPAVAAPESKPVRRADATPPVVVPPAIVSPPSSASPPESLVQTPSAVPPALPDRASPRPRIEPSAPAPSAADLLRAELELMEQARVAVRGHQHARALELLEAHASRFPNGAMLEERLAWLAIVSCERGDGRDRADEFASSYPKSARLAAVRAACDATATNPMDPSARQQ